MKAPNFMIKIIPHVDGSPRICELVRYYLEDITLKEAWTGPGALGLFPHALADVRGCRCAKWSRRCISRLISRSAWERWRSITWRSSDRHPVASKVSRRN